MKKTVKAWVVTNHNNSLHVQKDTTCIKRDFMVYALFHKRQDAEDTVFELYDSSGVNIYPCTITYEIPKRKGVRK